MSEEHTKVRRGAMRFSISILALVLIVAAVFYSSTKDRKHISSLITALPAEQSATTTSTQIVGPTSAVEIFHGDTSKKQVIFTFDGGATTESGDAILAVLAKHHVKGTFFLTGKMIEKNPDLVRRIVAAGHEAFNHTYDHKDLTILTDMQITGELDGMAQVLASTTNTTPRPYFRAPYGAQNAHVQQVAAQDGYQSVGWTVDALDWKEKQGETAAQVQARILSHVSPGTIYLMHVGDTITGSILDNVFTTIEAKDYKIVSLTQGL